MRNFFGILIKRNCLIRVVKLNATYGFKKIDIFRCISIFCIMFCACRFFISNYRYEKSCFLVFRHIPCCVALLMQLVFFFLFFFKELHCCLTHKKNLGKPKTIKIDLMQNLLRYQTDFKKQILMQETYT